MTLQPQKTWFRVRWLWAQLEQGASADALQCSLFCPFLLLALSSSRYLPSDRAEDICVPVWRIEILAAMFTKALVTTQ